MPRIFRNGPQGYRRYSAGIVSSMPRRGGSFWSALKKVGRFAGKVLKKARVGSTAARMIDPRLGRVVAQAGYGNHRRRINRRRRRRRAGGSLVPIRF